MPTFRWKGRGPDGHAIQGELEARNKEEVLTRLRATRIMVSEIEERGSGGEPEDPDRVLPRGPAPIQDKRPRPLRGLLIAFLFVLGAAAVGWMAPITTYECERETGGRAVCTIDERILGVYSLSRQSLAGVTAIERESRYSSTTSTTKGRTMKQDIIKQRLVLSDGTGQSIRPVRFQQEGGELGTSTAEIEQSLSTFLVGTAPGRVAQWQGPWVPLLIVAILLLIAILMIGVSILGMFAGSTKWVQDRTAALAAELEQHKSNH
jgi:hypothetical protein